MEEWKMISFAPKYEVSNEGRIRNATTKRILTPTKIRKNHNQQTIFLFVRRDYFFQREQHTISQIVYNHWCRQEGERETYYFKNDYKVSGNRIGHRDGNVYNNKADNLYRY